jgi:RNA polymerase sigma-70 factor (ECF subfamily)
MSDSRPSDGLEERVRAGDETALAELFARSQQRLLRMVRLRMDRRLQGRIDPADVMQEAWLDASRRLAEYAQKPELPPFIWLRFLAEQRLVALHRFHLGAEKRNAAQEVSLHRGPSPSASSASLASKLLGRLTSVSQKAIRAELRVRLQETLNGLDPLDREVLALRHFEELSNNETADVLGLSKAAASNRYVRALKRLKEALAQTPGFFEP